MYTKSEEKKKFCGSFGMGVGRGSGSLHYEGYCKSPWAPLYFHHWDVETNERSLNDTLMDEGI